MYPTVSTNCRPCWAELGPSERNPFFWQWQTATSRGDNWPALAVREGSWKLLLGNEADRVELFRFPTDRVEQTNLGQDHSDEVRRLTGLLDAWKATLPAKPNEKCLSAQRVK